MAYTKKELQSHLYRTVNFISYDPKVEHVSYTRDKLENDIGFWLKEYVEHLSVAEADNMYGSSGSLSSNRVVTLAGNTFNIGNLGIAANGNVSVTGDLSAAVYKATVAPVTDNDLDKLLAYDPSDGSFKAVDFGTIGLNDSVYSTDGTLAADRVMTFGANSLTFGSSLKLTDTITESAGIFTHTGGEYTIGGTGSLIISKNLPTTAETGPIALIRNHTTHAIELFTLSDLITPNLYKGDADLESDRTLDGLSDYSLTFDRVTEFKVNAAFAEFELTSTGMLYVSPDTTGVFSLSDVAAGTGSLLIGFDIDAGTYENVVMLGTSLTTESDFTYALADTATFGENTEGSAIIGGLSNSIPDNFTNAVILGKDSFIATASDTVFVDNFHSSGNVTLTEYGSGTITGTMTYVLGVDASGNVIEVPLVDLEGGGGGNFTSGVGDDLPTDPELGDEFYLQTNQTLYKYVEDEDGEFWMDISYGKSVGNSPSSAIKSTNFTAEQNGDYYINTSTGAVTVTVPSDVDNFKITDFEETWTTNLEVYVDIGTDSFTLGVDNAGQEYKFIRAGNTFRVYNDTGAFIGVGNI